MLFNSMDFLLFFPVVVFLYYVIPEKIRNGYLLFTSYFFYMCWNPKYILLILFVTIISYFGGRLIDRIKKKKQIYAKKSLIIVTMVAIVLNISILFFFKYMNLLIDSLNLVFRFLHIQRNMTIIDNIILPVGISFYTFQAIGYIIDVYRGTVQVETNFTKYALFISFFPQLVAGPIERSKNLLSQLSKKRKFDIVKAQKGILLMLWGYFLKLVIADRIAIYVDTVWAEYDKYTGYYLIIAVMLFAIQIYCDFYGYSIIAIGSASILGIQLTENFNAPYLSGSVTEFWRKWHISLTSWFKDYVYIPLGGGRKGNARKYLNKMIVFLLSGLWHGASFNFVVWGGINGIFQVLEDIFRPIKNKFFRVLHLRSNAFVYRVVKMIFTFVIIDFSWIFFRSNGLREAFGIIRRMGKLSNLWILVDGSIYSCGLDDKNFVLLLFSLLFLLIADLCKNRNIILSDIILQQSYLVRCLVFIFATIFILVFGIWGPAFDRTSFIYFQF